MLFHERLQRGCRARIVAGSEQLHRRIVLLLRGQLVGLHGGLRRRRDRRRRRHGLDRALRNLPEVLGRSPEDLPRRRGRGRRRRGFRSDGGHRRLGGRALLHRAQPLIEIADQLVEAGIERLLVVLELLDAAGQPADLLLELPEPDLVPRELTGLGLRQLDAPQIREPGAHGRNLAGQRRELGVGRGSERAGQQRERGAEPERRPSIEVAAPSGHHCVVVTTVTARRFLAHAASLWPGSTGRSSP
jgi:hypothetical protein